MEETVNRTCVHCQELVGFTVGDDGFFYCDNCGFQADDIFDMGVSEEYSFTYYEVNLTRFQCQDAVGSTITDGDLSDCDSCCSQADDIVDNAVIVPSQITQMHQPNRSSARSNKQRDITSDESSELKRPNTSLFNSSPDMPSNSLNSSHNSLAAMIKSISRKRELNVKASSSHHNKAPEENPRHMKSSP